MQSQFAIPRREVADGSLFGEAVGTQMLNLMGAVISFVKVQMKVTLANLIFLDLMLFILCHHRLKVVEQTFWQKVMKEVLKYLVLEFRSCCHDKGVFEHTKVPLLRPNYIYLSTDVWH